mgnify:CR=1 FL=1
MAPPSAWPARVISSYCTNGGCRRPQVSEHVGMLNAFSVTSYYIAAEGVLRPCSPTYAACNWTDSGAQDVGAYNKMLESESGAIAQPLVFSNSGDMVAAFRAMWKVPGGLEAAAAFLASQAQRYGYARIQLDLEPSCWAKNASECAWPTVDDADAFVSWVNLTAEALERVRQRGEEKGKSHHIRMHIRMHMACTTCTTLHLVTTLHLAHRWVRGSLSPWVRGPTRSALPRSTQRAWVRVRHTRARAFEGAGRSTHATAAPTRHR